MPNCCGRWGQGYLLNLGRGSIVDTAALAAALSDGVIAGAGLDVYESEPEPPAELLALDNLLLTPHVGGWSPESVEAQFTIYLQNLEGIFPGAAWSRRSNAGLTPV